MCTQLLGDFGADVIKVEPPEGDWGRLLGPPFYVLPDGSQVAAAYVGMNRNKRSIVVDLKRPEGREVVLRLVRSADVLVESFRPGVLPRLGLGPESLWEQNPRLVYCSISAFGQTGPWRDLPGVDGVVQAMSGLMSITGTEPGPRT
ncbi:MAG: CoA transferase [Armatimonadetes bacterium]|nr:CoA transferase [Armatimonadota bacterium]MDW8154432.1 CoA transferase [Armatimonadota bacterium]